MRQALKQNWFTRYQNSTDRIRTFETKTWHFPQHTLWQRLS